MQRRISTLVLLLTAAALSAGATVFTFNPAQAAFTPGPGMSFSGAGFSTLDFTLSQATLTSFSRSSPGEQTGLIYLGSLQLNESSISTGETDGLGLTIGIGINPPAISPPFSIAASSFTASTYSDSVRLAFPTAGQQVSFGDNGLLSAVILVGSNRNGTGAGSSTSGWDNDEYRYFFARFTLDQVEQQGPEIPEPATFILLGTALTGIGLLRRRR